MSENTPKKKRHWLRALLITLLVIVVVIIGAVVYVLLNLDSLAERAIETHGSRAAGTAVEVEQVDIQLTRGSAAVRGLTVANPAGFSEADCFTLAEVKVDLDLASLIGKVIRVEEIGVTGLDVFVEISRDARANLNELRKNFPVPASDQAQEPPAKTGPEQRLAIDKIIFSEGKVRVSAAALDDKTRELNLPRIELTGLSGTSDEITRQIIHQLSRRALDEVKRIGIDFLDEKYGSQIRKELKKQQERLESEVEKKKQELQDQVDSTRSDLKEKAEKSLKELTEELKKNVK